MEIKLLLSMVLVGLATYFMRYLPFKAGFGGKFENSKNSEFFKEVLDVAGVCIIASLFTGSLSVPSGLTPTAYFSNVLISGAIVCLTCFLWKNPGLSVISGIFSFACFSFFI